MLWDWLRYERPSRTPSPRAHLWEIPEPRTPRSLHPSPRHTTRALGQRKRVPIIRSWLEGGGPPPLLTPSLDLSLDTGLDMG